MFEQIATFVSIAETGNITRAARSLGISLPMASRHLRRLEEELGVALVNRTTRQLHLTQAGHEFVPRAHILLRELDDAKQALRPALSLTGKVVVTAPVTLGMYKLLSAVPYLAAKHPELQLELRLEDRDVDLLKEGVDLAIKPWLPPDSASIVAKELLSCDRVVCAAPGFLARHGPIDSLSALAAAPCIIYRGNVWDFETSEGRKSITARGPLTTNNLMVVRAAVLASVGVAWLPDYVVSTELGDGRIVRLLSDVKLSRIPVFAIMPKQRRQATTVRTVLDVLAATLRASYPRTPS